MTMNVSEADVIWNIDPPHRILTRVGYIFYGVHILYIEYGPHKQWTPGLYSIWFLFLYVL